MSKLVNVPIINQSELDTAYDFAIKEKENIFVIGPSGAGKTEMSFGACDKNKCNSIYWNMSVMERPDIQGLPAISQDKKTSFFAPQEGMPFVGLRELNQKRALEVIASHAEDYNPELADFISDSKEILKQLKTNEIIDAIKVCSDLFDDKRLQSLNIDKNIVGNESSNNVLILDEVDKTPPENLQPLLELLLYRTINKKPLDIQSVIMTGNLPDEYTYSEALSHAITNRAMVFELKPEHKIWLDWAVKSNLHPVVIGFLSKEENALNFFNTKPDGMYCYNYTSPRSWTAVSRVNYKFDAWLKKGFVKEELRRSMMGSIIGQRAAAEVEVWIKYFNKYDKDIDAIFAGSNINSPVNEESAEQNMAATIVIAFALARRFGNFASQRDETQSHEVQSKAAHIFGWISNNTPKDIRNASFRSCYLPDVFRMHNLHQYQKTKDMFLDMFKSYAEINSSEQNTQEEL